MLDRSVLRLSATLLFVGVLVSLLAGLLHPAHEKANDHVAVFAEYAASTNWTAVHLGQFVGIAILVAGLLAFFYSLNTLSTPNTLSGSSMWANRFGAVFAIVTLALYGVLQAVDGVALKQAVDAWASAPDAEKVARFATTEGVRWLEWAVRSYYSYMLGLSFIFFGLALVMAARPSRVVGYLMGLSGLAYLVQGWIVGMEGFSDNNSLPTLVAYLLIFVWSTWLFVLSWRMKAATENPTRLAATS